MRSRRKVTQSDQSPSEKVAVAVIGASGYTGAELVALLQKHGQVEICHLLVSENSVHKGAKISDLYPKLRGQCDLELKEGSPANIQLAAKEAQVVFLATDHRVSMELAPILLEKGAIVIDLSGAYRLPDPADYPSHYGFSHVAPKWLDAAVYGLPEWHRGAIEYAQLIAAPGCYPTSAILAIKPLAEAGLLEQSTPIVNSVSGVSGAGKKPSETTSYCEVSLKPYGTFSHRHQPEIDEYSGISTLFQPHLGPYKRGILTTVYAQLKPSVDYAAMESVYQAAYAKAPAVRLVPAVPCISQVENSPYCDIAFYQKDQQAIVFSAIDNLLKGAASQAMQCMNIRLGFNEMEGLS